MAGIERVSVAVLSWYGLEHLKTCLEALSRQRDPGVDWELLVLDNGSQDGTAEWVSDFAERREPRLRLIRSERNLGFCGGNMRLVEEATGDAVALVNNDTRPREDWLAALVDGLATAPDDVAAVSGMILDWEGERLDFSRGLLTFDGHAFQLGYHRPLAEVDVPPTGTELLFPCGGNLMIRRRSFLDAGGFDPSFFAYLEDVDLGWRLWSGGERVTFVADAIAHHRSMATSQLLGHYNRGFLFERNAFLTAYRNYEPELWQRLMPAILLTFLSRTQTMLVENNPGGSLLAIDPYAGAIANTAPAPSGSRPPVERWHSNGARGLVRRAMTRLGRQLLGGRQNRDLPFLTDERSVAQLRVVSYLLAHLDATAAARDRVQARRKRSDREIFERFPLHLVPTYPGDEELFSSPGFRRWLPDEPVIKSLRLDEIMCLD